MIKTALTGKQLAELYVLNTMGVPTDQEDLIENKEISPNQYSFLLDTQQGQAVLYNYALDLYNNIKRINDDRLNDYYTMHRDNQEIPEPNMEDNRPKDDELRVLALDYIADKFAKARISIRKDWFPASFYENLRQQPTYKRMDGSFEGPNRQQKFNFAMRRKSQQRDQYGLPFEETAFFDWEQAQREKLKPVDTNSWEWLDSDEVNREVESIAAIISEEVGNYDWEDIILNMWNAAFERNEGNPTALIDEFQHNLASLASDPQFMDDFWQYYFEEHKEDYESEPDYESDEDIRTIIYDPNDAHFAIDDVLEELENNIWDAQRSDDRDIYVKIMGLIDQLSSMSHHGGPAFEYGDTTRVPGEPSLIEIMNRKFGDRFISYVLSNDLLPEEYNEPLQKWYDQTTEEEGHNAYMGSLEGQSAQEASQNFDKEDYYKHPYYSQREKWIAENSPTFQSWTPVDSDYEDQWNLQSLNNVIQKLPPGGRRNNINNFLNNRGVDLHGAETLEDKTKSYRPKLQVVSKLQKIAKKIDKQTPSLADKIDVLIKIFN